jgi:hypothetical protein
MAESLAPRAGFQWGRVRWDAHDAPVGTTCSYCGAAIRDEAVPLRLWDAFDNACVFCDPCAAEWFGLQPMTEDDMTDNRADEAIELVEAMCAPDKMDKTSAAHFLEEVIARLESALEAVREEIAEEKDR